MLFLVQKIVPLRPYINKSFVVDIKGWQLKLKQNYKTSLSKIGLLSSGGKFHSGRTNNI